MNCYLLYLVYFCPPNVILPHHGMFPSCGDSEIVLCAVLSMQAASMYVIDTA